MIDFGGATYTDDNKSSTVNTRQYRAPEVILGVGWHTPSDIWSIGCIIAELYQGDLLFATVTHTNTLGYTHLKYILRSNDYCMPYVQMHAWQTCQHTFLITAE